MIFFDKASLVEYIQNQNDNTTVWSILIGEKTPFDIEEFIGWANSHSVNIFGGIFPAVVYKNSALKNAVIVNKITTPYLPFVIKGLDTLTPSIPETLVQIAQSNTDVTLQMYVDGLSSQIGAYLIELQDALGDSVNYVGGGAGTLALKPQPCVFTNDGFFKNAAVLGVIPLKSRLGVKHGWQYLEGSIPFVATRTDDNVIRELNWETAFTAYKSVVDSISPEPLSEANFFEVSKSFPFGIQNHRGEHIVRDPVWVNAQGGLVCIGEVPENACIDILYGTHERLVVSAGEAVKSCGRIDGEVVGNLMISCVSRYLFHGSRFGKELDEVQKNLHKIASDIELEGVLTLGEIASYGEGFLKFFNKAVVNCLLYK